MFDLFSQYLSYGSTDQATVRELAGSFDGLVVPGTVAAFQRDGTGGFVLTLSATTANTPYVIDPRFPLFQQALRQPKKSHQALAELVGVPALVRPTDPSPDDFDVGTVETIAERWIAFNIGYTTEASSKFDKYAKRLNEVVTPSNVSDPEFILPPYMVSAGPSDPWWQVSHALFRASQGRRPRVPCVRVVAAKEVRHLSQLLEDVPDGEQLIVWVSRLDELDRDSADLATYGHAIRDATRRGQRPFALYGGFFAVLLSSVGLLGASHGIGYGESRAWIELPQSGPPPARYYLPSLHRYVNQEFAYQLWLRDRALAECTCPECTNDSPVALDYHALMRHSVHCRTQEIESWVGMSTEAMFNRLSAEFDEFCDRIDSVQLPGVIQRQVERAGDHMSRWLHALEALAED